MAKPILHISLKRTRLVYEYANRLVENIKNGTDNEYHVLLTYNENQDEQFVINCYNDCKGLPDVDIEKLINDLHNGTTSRN